jgi:hypothetical protein
VPKTAIRPQSPTRFECSAGKAAIVRAYLVAENQMCFVAAHADASETIDGMTLRRQAKKRA